MSCVCFWLAQHVCGISHLSFLLQLFLPPVLIVFFKSTQNPSSLLFYSPKLCLLVFVVMKAARNGIFQSWRSPQSELKIPEVRGITFQSSGHVSGSHCSLGSSQRCISGEVSIHPAPSYRLLFQSNRSGRYSREAWVCCKWKVNRRETTSVSAPPCSFQNTVINQITLFWESPAY